MRISITQGLTKSTTYWGRCFWPKKMGKTSVIAETGAGQHGVATATAAALMGMECEVFMGKEDTERQALNVYRMRLLGAKVHAVIFRDGYLEGCGFRDHERVDKPDRGYSLCAGFRHGASSVPDYRA